MAKQTLKVLQSPVDHGEAFAAALLFRSTPASTFDYLWRVKIPRPSPPPRGGGGAGRAAGETEVGAAEKCGDSPISRCGRVSTLVSSSILQ